MIDLATLKPFDIQTIVHSVHKTRRCVIVDEAARFCGVGAEVAAQIYEKAFPFLKVLIQGVTSHDVTVPYAQLENHYLPSLPFILNAIDQILELI